MPGIDPDARETRQTRLIVLVPFVVNDKVPVCDPASGRPEDMARPRGHGSRPRPRTSLYGFGGDHGRDLPSLVRALETKRPVRIASLPALTLTEGESGHLSQLSNKNP